MIILDDDLIVFDDVNSRDCCNAECLSIFYDDLIILIPWATVTSTLPPPPRRWTPHLLLLCVWLGSACTYVHQCSISFIFNKIKKSLCSLWVCFLLQKTSSCCQDSCEFLTKVETSITGDGSLLPTPRNLTVTNRSFTSISLQWEAVKNTNGSPVYLIEMEASRGEAKYSPIYMEEVDWIKFFISFLWLKSQYRSLNFIRLLRVVLLPQ